MALVIKELYKNCNYLRNVTKPVKWYIGRNYPLRVLSSRTRYQGNNIQFIHFKQGFSSRFLRQCSTQSGENKKPLRETETKKPGLIQRFKEMYRDYWYVLLPVHMATSAIWFGSFYYAVRSGVDVLGMLESLGVNEKIIAPLRDSSAGYFALAFALYKLATPLRYAVTVGGTTYAIKRLTVIGWIKPVPSRERIKEILQEKKDNFQDRFIESKQHYQAQIKDKQSKVIEEMRRYKTEVRNVKDKVKKM